MPRFYSAHSPTKAGWFSVRIRLLGVEERSLLPSKADRRAVQRATIGGGCRQGKVQEQEDSRRHHTHAMGIATAILGRPGGALRAARRICHAIDLGIRVLYARGATSMMVSTDHTKMVKWPPWGRILHLPYLPIPKLVFLT